MVAFTLKLWSNIRCFVLSFCDNYKKLFFFFNMVQYKILMNFSLEECIIRYYLFFNIYYYFWCRTLPQSYSYNFCLSTTYPRGTRPQSPKGRHMLFLYFNSWRSWRLIFNTKMCAMATFMSYEAKFTVKCSLFDDIVKIERFSATRDEKIGFLLFPPTVSILGYMSLHTY